MPVDFKPLTLTPIDFSLTAGTSIPAPPDSPPRTPVKDQSSISATNGASKKPTIKTGKTLGAPDSKLAPPLSPMSSSSQSSGKLRKFLSLRSFRGSESNRNKLTKKGKSRPSSSMSNDAHLVETESATPNDVLKHKKSNGWFGSTSSSRRNSGVVVVGRLDERLAKEMSGPPPPTIPELGTLPNDIDGADLFKNIGNDITLNDLESVSKQKPETLVQGTPKSETAKSETTQAKPTIKEPSPKPIVKSQEVAEPESAVVEKTKEPSKAIEPEVKAAPQPIAKEQNVKEEEPKIKEDSIVKNASEIKETPAVTNKESEIKEESESNVTDTQLKSSAAVVESNEKFVETAQAEKSTVEVPSTQNTLVDDSSADSQTVVDKVKEAVVVPIQQTIEKAAKVTEQKSDTQAEA